VGPGATGPVAIEILDPKGDLVRRFSSDEKAEKAAGNRYFAQAWLKPAAELAATPGHHRWVWDLREPAPKAAQYEYSIAAMWGDDTPAEPEGAIVPPGRYTVRLIGSGRTETQPLTVKMDPRVRVDAEAIARQYALARQAAAGMEKSLAAMQELGAYRKRLQPASGPPEKELASKLAPFEGASGFAHLHRQLAFAFRAITSADNAPTAQAETTIRTAEEDLEKLLAKWKELAAATPAQ
jgi:hypothetical protein